MNVLTVNAGSSSLRLALFEGKDGAPCLVGRRHYAAVPGGEQDTLREFLKEQAVSQVATVVHRIVHGGSRLTSPCILDQTVEAEIGRLAPLAPLHNPVALKWIRAARAIAGSSTAQIAVFDTAFYANLPAVASTYALPLDLSTRYGLRRFGFHGLAHQGMWKRWQGRRGARAENSSAISLQLGAGCSITAIRDGCPIDTSMGFSPLDGLVMATRSGDVDPGLLLHLQRTANMTPDRMEKLLNEESGLLGLSGSTADMRALLASQEASARRAVELYCYRARKYVGAYLAALGNADALLIGGGVGEHSPVVREKILSGLQRLGIVLDPVANNGATEKGTLISRPDSQVEIWVLAVDEAQLLAEEAMRLLPSPP